MIVHPGLVSRRDRLPRLLARRNLEGRGVEVGVQRGVYSEVILAESRLSELLLVDPWQEFASDDYRDVSNVTQAEQDAALADTQQRIARFGARAAIWRIGSVEAAAAVPDASVDFVYLDARHDYEHVKEDLEAWYSKLRPRGIIAGHDYFDGEIEQGVYGVRSAVDEFFAPKGMRVYDTFEDRPWSSWIAAPPSRYALGLDAVRAALWFGFRARRKIARTISPT